MGEGVMLFTERELQTLEIGLQVFLENWQYDEGDGYEPIQESDIVSLIARFSKVDGTDQHKLLQEG
jgi:hypothetical protein